MIYGGEKIEQEYECIYVGSLFTKDRKINGGMLRRPYIAKKAEGIVIQQRIYVWAKQIWIHMRTLFCEKLGILVEI